MSAPSERSPRQRDQNTAFTGAPSVTGDASVRALTVITATSRVAASVKDRLG